MEDASGGVAAAWFVWWPQDETRRNCGFAFEIFRVYF